jgi:hypothetical protein
VGSGARALTRLARWSARSLAARETERSERRRARRKSMVIAVVASAAIAEPPSPHPQLNLAFPEPKKPRSRVLTRAAYSQSPGSGRIQ